MIKLELAHSENLFWLLESEMLLGIEVTIVGDLDWSIDAVFGALPGGLDGLHHLSRRYRI